MTDIETVIRDTRAIAADVAHGGRTGLSKARAPSSRRKSYPELLDDWGEANTVDRVVCLGAQLIADWMMEQKGPGAVEWPEKLQEWLDDWQNDFRRAHGGDEVAGFARLVNVLDLVADAIRDSHPVQ